MQENKFNPLIFYKNKIVDKNLAVSIVIKFALQQGIFYDLLEYIIEMKPYRKGNDDARFLVKYFLDLYMTIKFTRNLFGLFGCVERKWSKLIDDRFSRDVGALKIKNYNL